MKNVSIKVKSVAKFGLAFLQKELAAQFFWFFEKKLQVSGCWNWLQPPESRIYLLASYSVSTGKPALFLFRCVRCITPWPLLSYPFSTPSPPQSAFLWFHSPSLFPSSISFSLQFSLLPTLPYPLVWPCVYSLFSLSSFLPLPPYSD